MTVTQRLRAMVVYKYCAQCLAQSHTTANCPSANHCRRCKGDHHVLLHETTEAQCPNRRPKATPQRIRGLVSRSARATLLPVPPPTPAVLLPTARCNLVVGRCRIPVRGVLDLCAGSNLVLESVLRPTGLLRAGQNQMVELVMTTHHDLTLRVKFTAKVVRDITLTTPKAVVPDAVTSRFRSFKLADEQFGVPAPIQLVLAAAVYPQLVLPGLIMQQGLPVA